MSDATRVNTKPRKRPDQTGTLVGVRLQPDMLSALDKFMADQKATSRPEAVRLLLTDHLIGLGYLPRT